MKLRFIKVNPSGNTTIFILDPVARELYPAVGTAVMAYESVGAEQVGFIEKDDTVPAGWRMCMAGGEFCGNASRSFASWLNLCPDGGSPRAFAEEEREQVITVSGADKPLTARLTRMDADNKCYAKIDMPLPERVLTGNDPWFGDYTLVIFQGIAHLVLMNRDPRDEDVDKMRELLAAMNLKPDAFGLMYYDGSRRFMKPLVCVEESHTLVWENSCGSGTSALACALAHRADASLEDILIRQPGGELHVDVFWDKGVKRLVLGGVIEFTVCGELFVDV